MDNIAEVSEVEININQEVEEEQPLRRRSRRTREEKPKEEKVKEESTEISQKQIDNWRKRYGSVYKTVLNNQAFIWHKLRRNEYVEVMTDPSFENITSDERIFLRQEKIVNRVVLWPDNAKQLFEDNAGYVSNIADEIMFKSGFGVPDTEEL